MTGSDGSRRDEREKPSDRPQPPAAWEAVLRRVVSEAEREHICLELAELFRSHAHREGLSSARSRYRREVLAFALQAPLEMVRRWRRALAHGTGAAARQLARSGRSLRRAPGFALVAVLTLALGIGANVLIFALADRALVRPLPFPEPDRLVVVLDGWGTPPGTLEILQRRMTTLESVGGAWDAAGMTLRTGEGTTRRISAARVSPEYLGAVGVVPAVGRLFRLEEARPGRGDVVVLSWDFYHGVLGGEPSALDRTLTLENRTYRIVGVLPQGFDLPSDRNDVWLPLEMDPANAGLHWGMGVYRALGRMATGVTADQVREELVQTGEEVRLANPLWTPPPGFWDDARVTPLPEARSRLARTPLTILAGAVGVVLLVVCANVANLLLARGVSRRRDQAVRASMGAGAARLALEQMVEVLVLTLAGTAVGVALAASGLELLRPLLPPEIPGAARAGLDLRVLAATAGFGLLAAFLSGVIPALRVARRSPADLLRGGGRSGTASRARRSTTRVLVAAQMGAAVLLVAGAGLLARSLDQLRRVDPGFETEGRVTARLDLPAGMVSDPAARALYLSQLGEAVEADGALAEVALASTIPFGPEVENTATLIPGVTPDPNDLPVVTHRRVTPGWFDVVGIDLLQGRVFTAEDRLGVPLVAVVDRTFSERFFRGEDPVGRTIRYPWRGAPDMRIVGVVESTRQRALAEPPDPSVWVPLAQMGLGVPDHVTVVARSATDEDGGLAAVQSRVRSFDPEIAVSELAGYPALLRESVAGTRLLAILLGIFAGSTLLLGCVGVYGIVAFSVRERVREIGVRITLGADPARIRAGVLREGLRLALPGCALGLGVAVVAARGLESVLFGVATLDPLVFLGAPVVLVGAALLAVYVPARGATRVDPATVLREG